MMFFQSSPAMAGRIRALVQMPPEHESERIAVVLFLISTPFTREMSK